MTGLRVAGCPLCEGPGGRVVFEAPELRVIHAAEEGFPAFYRVVWKDHVTEWSDLAPEDRALCMNAVVAVEQCLREVLAPAKINLAALGNMVPHLHWHVIARFDWDTRFPAPVWAAAQRTRDLQRETAIEVKLEALERDMAQRMAAHSLDRSS
jgi:diadenosine tetraphosphate (Ap4A) HIT family hydrolase